MNSPEFKKAEHDSIRTTPGGDGGGEGDSHRAQFEAESVSRAAPIKQKTDPVVVTVFQRWEDGYPCTAMDCDNEKCYTQSVLRR